MPAVLAAQKKCSEKNALLLARQNFKFYLWSPSEAGAGAVTDQPGIGHVASNYLMPFSLLPEKKTRKLQLFVEKCMNNYEI